MKKLILSIALLFAVNAAAETRYGSKCGLFDYSGDFWEQAETIRTLSFNKKSDEEISSLPTLTKQQLIIAAKVLTEEKNIKGAAQAVRALRGYSSDGVAVTYYRLKGKNYTEVIAYPGDNPYAVLFITGSRSIVAHIQDSDVVCK